MQVIKRNIRKMLDMMGFTIIPNNAIPVGTDYRKTIRNIFGEGAVKTVFDVGANVGQFCIHANEVFSNAIIHSFEPVSKTFELLRTNTNKFNNIKCHKLAFGSAPGTEKIFLQDNSVFNSLSSSVNVQKKENQATEVIEIQTVDSFCEHNKIDRIDLLKVDTEGFDLNVLEGAISMLSSRKVKFVLIEVTFDKENTRNSSFNLVNDFLGAHSYKVLGFFNQSVFEKSNKLSYCDALFCLQD
jgi:FkbM family methyltransferase